jgi:Tol biopolymer transport system component
VARHLGDDDRQITTLPPGQDLPQAPDGSVWVSDRALLAVLIVIGPDQAMAAVGKSGSYVIYSSKLDGSGMKLLGEGTWPSVSPDGSKTVYSASGGLDLADGATGTVVHLPGTTDGDYSPRWSPDGTQIAFVRLDDLNLYVMDSDGEHRRQVTKGPEYELLAGWSPDNAHLFYAVPSSAGRRTEVLDIETGSAEDLFVVGLKEVPSISPDGRQMVHLDRVFGEASYGLYLRSIEGSEPRLLAYVDGQTISAGIWSPDGKWILISAYGSDEMFPTLQLTVINVNTCQVIRLPWLAGYVQ